MYLFYNNIQKNNQHSLVDAAYSFCRDKSFPKGLLTRIFENLYYYKLVDSKTIRDWMDEAFEAEEEDEEEVLGLVKAWWDKLPTSEQQGTKK